MSLPNDGWKAMNMYKAIMTVMTMMLLTMTLNTRLLMADDCIAESNQAEQIILNIGQEYSISIIYSEKEKVSWQVTSQECEKQKIIEVDVNETPIPTFWYHPDLAPALNDLHFTIRALSLGTAHLIIHFDPRNENNKQKRVHDRDRDLLFLVVS